MIKILFVCHGNICRSPMAEFIFRKLAAERGMADRFTVASCATSTEEIFCGTGNPVYPPAREELKKHGIDCGGKRAVQLQRDDYEKYDLFIGMDQANIQNMYRILGGDRKRKIRRLMDYTDRGGDVADPWYSDRFDIAYRDIYDGCAALLDALLAGSAVPIPTHLNDFADGKTHRANTTAFRLRCACGNRTFSLFAEDMSALLARCSRCEKDIPVFDSRLHGFEAKYCPVRENPLPPVYEPLRVFDGKAAELLITVENDESLAQFRLSTGHTAAMQEYADAFSWITVQAIAPDGETETVLDAETA